MVTSQKHYCCLIWFFAFLIGEFFCCWFLLTCFSALALDLLVLSYFHAKISQSASGRNLLKRQTEGFLWPSHTCRITCGWWDLVICILEKKMPGEHLSLRTFTLAGSVFAKESLVKWKRELKKRGRGGWKQSRCPSVGEWVKKSWYIQTVEYISQCWKGKCYEAMKRWNKLKYILFLK